MLATDFLRCSADPQVGPAKRGIESHAALDLQAKRASPRSQAAAKVDALSNNGMDDIDIPAFLRKQAD